MRFNPEQVLSLANMANDRDWSVVRDALAAELMETTERLLKATDPVSIYREQGRAEVLRTILESAEAAKGNARKAQEQQHAKARSAAGNLGTWTA